MMKKDTKDKRDESDLNSKTRNPEPGTRNPEPGTRNPEPGTRNPEPGTLKNQSTRYITRKNTVN